MEAYTRDGIVDRLGTRVVGRHVRWHDALPSTNELAMCLAEIHVPEGTVVVAEEQTAGRGRRGRTWVSPRGRTGCPSSSARACRSALPLVGLAVAVAAARAIRVTTRLAARVKWPNDVLLDGGKVAGVLTEAGPDGEWIVGGWGSTRTSRRPELPQDPRRPALSLAARLGAPVDRGELTRYLLREIDRAYGNLQEAAGPALVVRSWREMADTLGQPVRVEGHGRTVDGIAVDVDELGALLVRTADGALERVVAGEVTLRGPE